MEVTNFEILKYVPVRMCNTFSYELLYTHYTHTHKHTHIHIYMRVYVFICVPVYVRVRVCVCMYVCVCSRSGGETIESANSEDRNERN